MTKNIIEEQVLNHSYTENLEIFAIILFSQIALKDILVT